MTELTQGIFRIIATSSMGRATVYTMGHIIIAMNVVYWLTGVSFFEAGLVGLVEPLINGCWYYFLDRLITNYSISSKQT